MKFNIHTFDNETTVVLKLFEIFTEMHFVFLFFQNGRNNTTKLLMIHLKVTVLHYVELNSSSINKSFLGAVDYVISFFSNSSLLYFNEAFVKNFMKKLPIFNTGCSIPQNIRM